MLYNLEITGVPQLSMSDDTLTLDITEVPLFWLMLTVLYTLDITEVPHFIFGIDDLQTGHYWGSSFQLILTLLYTLETHRAHR